MSCRSCHLVGRLTLAALVVAGSPAMHGQQRGRAKVPDKYKWNLAEIYLTEDAWRAAKDRLVAEIPELRSFRGTLSQSARRRLEVSDRSPAST